MGRLDGKVAIITGAGQGLGEKIAAAFVREGAKVVGTDIAAERVQVSMAKLVERYGDCAIGLQHDITNREDWDRIVVEAAAKFGKLDIVANVAGIASGKPVMESTVEDFIKVYRTDCMSLMLSVQAASPEMEKSGKGAFVTIGSVAALASGWADGNDAAYCAAKGALRSLNRHCAYHMMSKDIRVNLVMPAVMDTPLSRASMEENPEVRGMLASLYPLKPHLIDIDCVVNAVIFAASDEACSMTGSEIVLDGGCLTQ